ncbi:MAG: hypothetical protein ACK5KO_07590, partial [Arachnia sp.]
MTASSTTTGGRRKLIIGAVLAALVLLGGAYVASYFIAGNRTGSQASVAGVDVGGMTGDEARQHLEAELGPLYAKPIVVSHGEVSVEIDPAEAGLAVDYDQAVTDVGGGFSWNPVTIFRNFTGGVQVEEVPLAIDRDALLEALTSVAEDFSRPSSDAAVAYVDGAVQRTESVDATELDTQGSADEIIEAFEAQETQAEAALDTVAPAVTSDMVDEIVESYAEPAISGPVTITTGEQSFEITPAQIAQATTFKATKDGFVPETDGEKLLELTGLKAS